MIVFLEFYTLCEMYFVRRSESVGVRIKIIFEWIFLKDEAKKKQVAQGQRSLS